ncbi:epoxide hydrolase [soil metagenome]
MSVSAPQPYEVAVADQDLDGLRARLRATRWDPNPGPGWEFGGNQTYLRELCSYWAEEYDWRALEGRINALENFRWDGIHFIYVRADGGGGSGGKLPIVLLHGWPGGPIEFLELIPLLSAGGHDVIVPSLPGYAFSGAPDPPLNVAGISGRLIDLLRDGLGLERVIIQGGDWGAIIGPRIAYDAPDLVAGIHVNAAFALPIPANLSDPPLSEAEQAYAQEGMRSMRREGYHLVPQGRAPDAMAPGMLDSPAGQAAWLVEKYRSWSDCGGEIERRFSKRQTCDLLTLYWVTGTIGSSMRLYAAEARDRWRLSEGETIGVPAAVADFPIELLRPPREWVERNLTDLRSWTEMPSGGHFAAIEEPELLGADVLAFAATLAD